MRNTILLILLFTASWASSQEVEVPFDSAGKIMVFTAEMEISVHLFPKVSHFIEARLLKRDADHFVVDYTYRDGSQIVHAHEDRDGASVAAMRSTVSTKLKRSAPSTLLDHSSRVKFITYETVLSTFLYGPLIMASIQVNDFIIGAGIELLIGGAGFLVPYALTQEMSMSDAQSSLGLGCAFLGIGHGALIDMALSARSDGRELTGVIAATSIVETAIGCAVASGPTWTEGKADMTRYGGLFGGMLGIGTLELITTDFGPQAAGAAGLAGSGVGFVLGTMLANDHEYTRGNATVSLTAGLFGPYALLSLSEPLLEHVDWSDNTGRLLTGIGMVGNIGGVLLTHELIKDKRLSTGQGNLILVGTSAGWLVGTGIGFLLSSSTFNSDMSTAASFTIPSALGTIGGFAISYYIFSKADWSMGSNWEMNINPATMAMAAHSPMGTGMPFSYVNIPLPPMASLLYRF